MKSPKKGALKAPKAAPLPPETAPQDESELSGEVLEFATAMDAYKRRTQRPFPNWSEVLEVLRGLGYRKDRKSA